MMIYDHFTPFVIISLEAYGFCEPGEGGAVRRGRPDRVRRRAARQHARRQPLRGVHPRAAARHRGGAPAARRPPRPRSRTPSSILSCSSVAQLSAAVDPEEGLTPMLHGLPRPRPDLDTQPFWDGCRRSASSSRRARSAAARRWPPGPMCPSCRSTETDVDRAVAAAAGVQLGRRHTPVDPVLVDQVPYVVGDDRPRGGRPGGRQRRWAASPTRSTAGMAVELFFEDAGGRHARCRTSARADNERGETDGAQGYDRR